MIHILTLNWNGLDDTTKFLESLKKSNYKNFKVYILDNGSKIDETKELNRHSFSNVRFFRSEENLGFTGGNNFLLNKVNENPDEENFIFLLNNDTTIDENLLTELINCAEKYPKAGFFACKMLQMDNSRLIDSCGHEMLNVIDCPQKAHNEPAENYNSESEVIGTSGGAMFIRKKVVDELGLFHEHMFLNREDVDFSYRAIMAGFKCIFCPKAIVYHKGHAAIKKVKKEELSTRNQKNQILAYYYNMPWQIILLNAPWIILRDIFVIVGCIIFGRFKFLKVFLKAKLEFLSEIKFHNQFRKKGLSTHKMPWCYIWFKQKNFIPFYTKQFFKYFVGKKETNLG